MKLSLAWIFDHIDADWRQIDIAHLVALFNEKTAEIEGYTSVHVEKENVILAQVKEVKENVITLVCGTTHQSLTLPTRKDVALDAWYLVIHNSQACTWATMNHLGGHKELLLPALAVENNVQQLLDALEYTDYILHVDNKSITHRPDLWGHRGFAQEIALLLHVPLKPLDTFLQKKSIQAFDRTSVLTDESGFAITLQTSLCERFASLYIPHIAYTPSLLWMAARLSRVDSRPIDMMVDLSNYVMQDMGQPMHVFDAHQLDAHPIAVRMAQAGERLKTLDGDTLQLSSEDIVIAQKENIISLAGVMGGSATAVSKNTASILIESAAFAPTPLRLSAARHKKRTEASTRFEKSLDPNQNTLALERFMQLLQSTGIPFQAADTIISLGQTAQPKIIELSHALLESALGVQIEHAFVQDVFNKLGFTYTYDMYDCVYTVTVESRRSRKDITIAQDLIEEVGRLYGYNNIVPLLPPIVTAPSDLNAVKRLRLIKYFFSAVAHMHEVQNYAFFDESFLPTINCQPQQALVVESPVSNNWVRLVTSLMPGLCKAIEDNACQEHMLRFFEIARTWSVVQKNIVEYNCAAGIFFDHTERLTFYTGQDYLMHLFSMIGISVTWEKIVQPTDPWFAPYQTASIMHKNRCIGKVGVVPSLFLRQITKGGSAIAFELDVDYLQHCALEPLVFSPLSKFPPVSRDISLLIPLDLTVQKIKEIITGIDNRISGVELVDYFTHESWENKRALTIRFTIADYHKTLTKEEVDALYSIIINRLFEYKVTIR